MIKRILSVALILAMLMSMCMVGFAATPAKVSVTGDGEAAAGEAETFTVEITDNPGVAAVILVHTITHKSSGKDVTAKFTHTGNWLTAGDLIRDDGDVVGTFTRNGANISWTNDFNVEGDGVFCTMKVTPAADLINGTYVITLALKEGLVKNFCNEETDPVDVQFVSYEFELTGGVDLSDYEPTVKTQPTNGTYTYKTDAADALTAEFQVGTQGTVTTQWYKCDADGKNPVKVGDEGNALTASYVPALPAVGTTEYYYCEIINEYDAENSFAVKTNVASVTYNPGDPTKALLDVTIPSSGEYTGSAYVATVAAKAGVEGLGAITVKYNGETEAPTAVGTYTVTVDIAAGTNYKAVTGLEVGSFTISKAKVTVPTVAQTSFVYTGTLITLDVPTSDLYNVNNNTSINVGDYTANITLKDTANYEWATSFSGQIAWEITPATIVYSGANTMTVYNNGNEFPAPVQESALTVKGGQNITIKYVEKSDDNNLITVTEDGKVKGNAEEKTGTATIEATVTVPNHNTLTVEITVTVQNKQVANVTFAASTESKVYTGSDIALSEFFIAAATCDQPGDITYELDGVPYATFAALQAATVKNAGTYTVKAIYENDTYYGEKAVTITVEKATPAVTVDNYTTTYTGTAVKVGDLTTSASVDGVFAFDAGTAEMLNAATYTNVKVVFTPDDSANYESVTTTITVTINPRSVDVSGVTFTQADITFDGEAHTVAVSGLPAEGVKVEYIGDVTKTNVGAYTATATLSAADGNHVLSGTTELTLNWNIVKAPYQNSTVDAVYRYTETGDKSFEITLPENCGSFSITEAGSDSAGIVSGVSYDGAKVTYTLSGAAAAGDTATYVFTVTTENYADFTVTLTITLTDRDVPVVTVETVEVTYTGTPITAADLTTTSSVPGTWTILTDVSAMVNAGEYEIDVKFVPENTVDYVDVTVEDVKLIIKKADPTVEISYEMVTSNGTLADANLAIANSSVPGTVEWKLPLDTVVEMNTAYEWVFTPDDQTNYNTVEGSAILFRAEGSGIPSNPITPTPGAGDLIAPWVNPYSDVKEGTWYYDSVKFVTIQGLMQGVGDGKFAPGGYVTRGTLMTILARRAGVNTEGGSVWYEKGMEWAVATGISDGTNPTANITREQIVTMLWRAVGSPNFDHISIEGFADDENVSDWALDAVKWAVGAGLLNGKDGNRLDPTGTATRAELAAILTRFCKTYG